MHQNDAVILVLFISVMLHLCTPVEYQESHGLEIVISESRAVVAALSVIDSSRRFVLAEVHSNLSDSSEDECFSSPFPAFGFSKVSSRQVVESGRLFCMLFVMKRNYFEVQCKIL